jgi:hypothetical protein
MFICLNEWVKVMTLQVFLGHEKENVCFSVLPVLNRGRTFRTAGIVYQITSGECLFV